MRFILDTNVVSEATREFPHPHCDDWLTRNIEECGLTTITLGELRYGVERLPNGKKKRQLERELDFLWTDFQDRILDFDDLAAYEYGRYVAEYEAARGLAAVEHADVRDFQIAAIARAHGWIVATRNIRHFDFVQIINPFDQAI